MEYIIFMKAITRQLHAQITNAIVIFTTNPRPFIQLFKGGRSGPDVTFWFTVP